MRAPLVLLSLVLAVPLAACHHDDNTNPGTDAPATPVDAPMADGAEPPAVFRTPLPNMTDGELALKSLDYFGALPTSTDPGCTGCHGMTTQHIRYWRALTDTAMNDCITSTTVTDQATARSMIECMREMPNTPGSPFSPLKLGVIATAASGAWFENLFKVAYGPDAPAYYADFKMMVQMPRGGQAPFTQAQFDIVAEWFSRGAPLLEETLPPDTSAPSTCDPGVSNDVVAHVADMKINGWRQLNKDAGIAMYGCGGAATPLDCLATVPFGSDQAYGVGWDVPNAGRLRVLYTTNYRSSYWSRSSPDGRFLAQGGGAGGGSSIIDFQRGVTVSVDAAYDPGFFPDNTGFVFQGASNNSCPLSVLTSNPAHVSMTETGCADLNDVSLYQHLGRGLGGGDYTASTSDFASDSGGHSPTFGDTPAFFGATSTSNFVHMVLSGGQYVPHDTKTVVTPYEGDTVVSPSATMAITRTGSSGGAMLGFVVRKVVTAEDGVHLALPEVARFCVSGGKPAFSYDERWLVYHHYMEITNADAQDLGFTGTTDPGFQPYATKGTANLYLIDMLTGVSRRITNMRPGQYALFPHFRSDGWIYADVRDTSLAYEHLVASDAALLAE